MAYNNIDWEDVQEQIANGKSINDVALELDLKYQTVWKKLEALKHPRRETKPLNTEENRALFAKYFELGYRPSEIRRKTGWNQSEYNYIKLCTNQEVLNQEYKKYWERHPGEGIYTPGEFQLFLKKIGLTEREFWAREDTKKAKDYWWRYWTDSHKPGKKMLNNFLEYWKNHQKVIKLEQVKDVTLW